MKLIVTIEYRTRWGEELVCCLGDRRIRMMYVSDGIWQGEAARFSPDRVWEYWYEVVKDGKTIRREWKKRRFAYPKFLKSKVLCLRDRWIDRPYDAPFLSSAFTGSILRRGKDTPAVKAAIADVYASDRQANVVFSISAPSIKPDEVLAIAGSSDMLGNWNRIIPMESFLFPEWNVGLYADAPFEYKFLIADADTLEPLFWEDGPNRYFSDLPGEDETVISVEEGADFRGHAWKGAGTAIPVFSLRSEDDFGVGEFYDLKKMVDWAAATGQSVLQLLPINDTTMSGTWEDSYPYNPNSTFALHPQYINLPAAGVKVDEQYKELQAELNALGQIDYERVNKAKIELLRKAYSRTYTYLSRKDEFILFVERNKKWLYPYAMFCVLRDKFGTADFSQWGKIWQTFDKKWIDPLYNQRKKDVEFWYFVQYHLDRQLSEVCDYAHSKGVIFKGDLPIGVSRTSVDAWLYPELFHMDSQAGAPPDAFSEFGQNWGFPTYNWERMAKDGFAWWKARLAKMSEYFDAFRIDHILGFFRIWEIPSDAVHGLLGHFNPAMPYSADELAALGFEVRDGRWVSPLLDDNVLYGIFGDLAEDVKENFIRNGRLIPEYSVQRNVTELLSGDDERTSCLREGLWALIDDVLFVEDPVQKGYYHPRISAHSTYVYRSLDAGRRSAFERLYDDFFYRRHNDFWRESAMMKLPELLDSTGMLACGEDLGMIPACVPEVMDSLRILSLEIQRMPKSVTETFADPANYPYLSVCTTSTHDMNPIRAWWEEDGWLTERFWQEVIGGEGAAPAFCEPWICRRILEQHLMSPAMLTVLPLQDWLSMDGELRFGDPEGERINVPANSRHYWRYRMHITLEELASQDGFNEIVRKMIKDSGRC